MLDEMIASGNLASFDDGETKDIKHRCQLCERRPFRWLLLLNSRSKLSFNVFLMPTFVPRFKSNAVDHVIKAHNLMPLGCRLYRCLVEPKTCKFESFLKSRIVFHFRICHKRDYGGQMHACSKCDKQFNWAHQLKVHMSQEHSDPQSKEKEKPFQCPECGHLSK